MIVTGQNVYYFHPDSLKVTEWLCVSTVYRLGPEFGIG